MITLAWISLGLLLFVALEQFIAITVFVRYCRAEPQATEGFQPEVLVILPVRGADATLGDCIAGLAQQDYPNYRIRVIFDSDTDPGWRVIDNLLESQPDLPIEVLKLRKPYESCSLKCSSVYEATEDLEDAEVVALLDSDIVPHQTWLSEIVAPLAEKEIGVVTGNRWYLPEQMQWGSMMRYCWNAVAVVAMYIWGMPWGGTMAIKRSVLETSDVRQRWLKAGCEDVPLGQVIRELGLKVRFLPSLIMVDRDETQIKQCFPFLDRQLLWTRLYYPACWWVNNLWQIVIASATVIALVCALYGALTADFTLLGIGFFAIFFSTSFSLLMMMNLESLLIPHEKGPSTRNPWKTFWAIAFTNLAMVRVVFVSLFARSTRWRGIDYRIAGPWQVELLEYHPYAEHSPTATEPNLTGATSLH